jgi:hypothetical protein
MPGVSDPETTQESIQPNLAEFFSMKRKRRDDQAHTIGNPGACRLLLHDGHEGNPLKRDETRYVKSGLSINTAGDAGNIIVALPCSATTSDSR